MKSILAATGFLIVVIFHSCTGPAKPNKEYQNNRQTYHLNGKVKSVSAFNYKRFIPDSVETYGVTKEYYKFDAAGNCTELTTFLQQESFQSRNVYQYDAAGNYTELISYDEDGSLRYRMTYTFDDEGNTTDISNYSSSGELKYREQHTYGPNRSFEKIRYGVQSPGSTSTYKYTYDSLRRYTSLEYYNHDGDTKPEKRTIYSYSGDTTRETGYDRLGAISLARVWVYDKNKRLTGYIVDPGGPKMSVKNYKYDTSGNELECIVRNSAGIDLGGSYRYEYKYDGTGNWIKRTTYNGDGTLRFSIERKIEYY